jgi:hypothetical protein
MHDQGKPGWEGLDPALQRWQEMRLRDNAYRGIAIEAVTHEVTPRQVGACFLFPPNSLHRWFKPSWWAVLFQILYEKYIIQPTETLSNPEVSSRLVLPILPLLLYYSPFVTFSINGTDDYTESQSYV